MKNWRCGWSNFSKEFSDGSLNQLMLFEKTTEMELKVDGP
jgi:ABC-type transport system involved in cytochrome c biogenesis permease component